MPLFFAADGSGGEGRADEDDQKDLDAEHGRKDDFPRLPGVWPVRPAGRLGIGQVNEGDEAAHQRQINGEDDKRAPPAHPAAQFFDGDRVLQQRPQAAETWLGLGNFSHNLLELF